MFVVIEIVVKMERVVVMVVTVGMIVVFEAIVVFEPPQAPSFSKIEMEMVLQKRLL